MNLSWIIQECEIKGSRQDKNCFYFAFTVMFNDFRATFSFANSMLIWNLNLS